MSEDLYGNHATVGGRPPIDFTSRLALSEGFKALFREGMGLVEETAQFLDGPGREQSRGLSRTASLTYATESMRLTTRLMQLASWLLLQRAVNEGEMTQDQAGHEKAKVRLDSLSTSRQGPGWDELPDGLKALVERSIRLQERVRRLDDALYHKAEAEPQPTASNPVAAHLDRLSEVFGGRQAQ